ncbi:MAG: hypothetical protein HY820_24420 [Acidobacteria bacterium]|nr:hypothetical protein [Acidobacteriota bacterium]
MRFAAGLWPVLLALTVPCLSAAPKLRLTTTTVGPASVAEGSNGPAQTIEAYNAGDGNLNLTVSSTASWVSASVGASRPCSLIAGNCLPVNFSFQTSALGKGTFTAAVNINDSSALDAPQIVTVTVQVGGGVPDSASFYVAPNGSADEVRFATNSQLAPAPTTQDGNPWLSMSVDGGGSFRFVVPYKITARHQEGMEEGSYTGSLAIRGSGLAAENKTVQVQLTVTSQPIARVSPATLDMRLAAGGPELSGRVTVYNGGMGTLSVNGATAATTSGGNWLSATANGGTVVVTVNSSGLSNGSYSGTVTVNSNAANSNVNVPVQLTVVPQGAPVSLANGVLNAGNQDNGLAQGGIATVNGEQLSNQAPERYAALPLSQTLGGVRVLVNDQAAPVLSSAYNQVSFQVPYEANAGEGVVRVERDGQPGNAVSVNIAPRAPRILQQGDYGIIANKEGTLTTQRAAKPGEAVTLFVVGLGPTTPTVTTGDAAPTGPLAVVKPTPRVVFGNAFSGVVSLDPLFAGLVPGSGGLYQVTVLLPTDVPLGDLPIALEGDDFRSNTVLLPIRE